MVSLKAFFVEKGADLSQDESLQIYMKLPSLIEKMPKDNETLSFLLSKDFTNQIIESNGLEIERIYLFASNSLLHRSFITKIYEYYLKYHPSGQNEVHSKIYSKIEESMSVVQGYVSEYQSELEEINGLYETLEKKSNDIKSRYKMRVGDEINKGKRRDLHRFSKEESIEVKQIGSRQREMNGHYFKIRNEMGELIKEVG